eukprot:TRINITY_DN4618_c1_g1_i1.p1 TRINITY_DN4618_c1_g1~~TRINITY_DN4618_c1_g1_i1.p1  ORF type:complete len:965 (+),score=398.63 TRINITY_DN4618_c1_g1_i1:3-2897(+)
MMQEADEEDIELVSGGRRELPSFGINSDSSVLKKGLIGFAAVVIFINFVVFIAGIRLAKDYVPSTPVNPPIQPLDPLPPWTSFRLPKTTIPLAYSLNIHADLNQFVFHIAQRIDIEISEKRTRTIYLHSSGLNVTDVFISKLGDSERFPSSKVEFNTTNEYVTFEFGNTLSNWLSQNQTRFTLTFNTHGIIGDVARGFYRSSYLQDGKLNYLAVTDFEPTDARSAFVCFDEPSFKATFEITVSCNVSDGFNALSNMNLLSSSPSKDFVGFSDFHFEKTPKMSTYLVCYVVSRFEFVEPQVQGKIPVRVFGPPKEVQKGGKFAAEAAKKIVEGFGEYFGIDYALPKLDLIALPDFTSGAMENWGLITFRIEALLWDPEVSSTMSKQNIAMIVSHEIAHQWFGNLVTMDWWDNVWLNEGFASFVEYLGVELTFPEWNIWSQFIPLDRSVAMELDALASSHPLDVPIEKASEITQQFDAISYSKGASVIRMLQDLMDSKVPNSFRDGIRFYLKKRAYGNARTEDLWNLLVESTQQTEVPSFMKGWTEQVGFPYVSLSKSWSNQLQATQKKFMANTNSSSPSLQRWPIPLSIQDSNGIQFPFFAEESVTLDVSEGFLVGNVNGSGFYRVLYDSTLLSSILNQLESNHLVFSDQTRASLLNDAFALNLAQKVPASYALSMTSFMSKERSYVSWSTALSSLSNLKPFIDERTEVYPIYQRYLSELLNSTLNDLGWQDVEGELHSTSLLRPLAYAASLSVGTKEVVEKGYQKFEALKNGSTTDASKDLNGVIYNSASLSNDEAQRKLDYDWLVNRYLNENQATEKNVLLSSITKFSDRARIEETLAYSINISVVKPKDTSNVLVWIARNSPLGRDLSWNFFKNNIGLFKQRYGEAAFILDRLIRTLTSLFSTEAQRADVESFFATNPIGQGSRTIAQSLEQISVNIKWRKMNEAPIKDWFDQWASKHPKTN